MAELIVYTTTRHRRVRVDDRTAGGDVMLTRDVPGQHALTVGHRPMDRRR